MDSFFLNPDSEKIFSESICVDLENMKGLHVKGQPVKCNRFGNPLVSSFLELLLPDPAGYVDRQKALTAYNLDYIIDLTDYVKRVARKLGVKPKHILDEISFVKEKPPKKSAFAPPKAAQKKRPLIVDEDDDEYKDDLFDNEEEEEVESSAGGGGFDNSDYEEEEEEVVAFGGGGNEGALATNASALRSIALVMAHTDREAEADYYRLLKDTTLPFIKAIREHGPLFNSAARGGGIERPLPEKQGERLFGVSQRIEDLGADVPANAVSQVGKRALELYRKAYPGHTPPQRVVVNEHGHEYLMNQYSETTAKKTLDLAIREANGNVQKRFKTGK